MRSLESTKTTNQSPQQQSFPFLGLETGNGKFRFLASFLFPVLCVVSALSGFLF